MKADEKAVILFWASLVQSKFVFLFPFFPFPHFAPLFQWQIYSSVSRIHYSRCTRESLCNLCNLVSLSKYELLLCSFCTFLLCIIAINAKWLPFWGISKAHGNKVTWLQGRERERGEKNRVEASNDNSHCTQVAKVPRWSKYVIDPLSPSLSSPLLLSVLIITLTGLQRATQKFPPHMSQLEHLHHFLIWPASKASAQITDNKNTERKGQYQSQI